MAVNQETKSCLLNYEKWALYTRMKSDADADSFRNWASDSLYEWIIESYT